MPDLYRVTWAFSGQKQGWSESHVIGRNNTTSGALASDLLILTAKRAELLARQYQCDGFRVAKIRNDDGTAVKRNVFLVEQVFKPSNQAAANDGSPTDDAVLVRGTDAPGTRKVTKFFGGIPDDIVIEGGRLDTSKVGWQAKFDSWNAEAINKQLGWLASVIQGEASITGYATNPALITEFTLDANLFAFPNPNPVQTVRIRQLNTKSVFNKQLLIRVTAANKMKTVRAIAAGPFVSEGFVARYQLPKPHFVAAGWGALKYGSHKRGRPLFSTRGRAPVRAVN